MNVNPRIFGACIVGVGLVGGAFLLPQHIPAYKTVAKEGSAAQYPTPPKRTYIEVIDSNGDTIPDWQESFIDTVINLDGPSSTSKYSRPTTTTGQFAIGLAEEIMKSNASGNFEINSEKILANKTAELYANARGKIYTKNDLIIQTNNDPVALRGYGNRIAIIATSHPIQERVDNEIVILERALSGDDETELEMLDLIIPSYEGIITDLLKSPVPSDYVEEHLALINVCNELLQDAQAFRNAFRDPLPMMLRLQRYSLDANGLYTAISNLYLKLDRTGIKWNESDAASQFIKVIE